MVIGAAALAVHGYARQSVDLDLATYENPFESFDNLAERLAAAGCVDRTVNHAQALCRRSAIAV